MDSAEIAKGWGCEVGDVIALFGNAYKITSILDKAVYGTQIVESGREVGGFTLYSLDLRLNGWQLIL